MNEHDPADLDGDGKFDAIDIMIMEEDKQSNHNQSKNSGCCVMLIVLGSAVSAAGWYGIYMYLA